MIFERPEKTPSLDHLCPTPKVHDRADWITNIFLNAEREAQEEMAVYLRQVQLQEKMKDEMVKELKKEKAK
jgi:hypothetical protein